MHTVSPSLVRLFLHAAPVAARLARGLPPAPPAPPKRRALPPTRFACQECGHTFRSLAAAERASFGPEGCPECGGADIDEAVSLRRAS